ncbi:MSMEG_0569 family flavin-dependent oxidoreductase [Thermoleptolyngbya sichuanensis A183]|uniref:MSMEG_0569 family flavin-dependent oxidoreductase n=1 Tax=Thermoleptolyngbya sichuanensis A183 TaxID=2737172 RepID=A0A6M8B6F4_9CYAN|nr:MULTISPECIES: MSMEG_0569 family flavin-dependent oxidoreductase [Thermoleptolyngbya]QKD82068.1 MSMEG_0569 family flavin-dependent oxidoreductase [Thermoleptolyngbya sichuanensis A183]
MEQHYPVIVVGGGQAGLSMSYCLKQRGIAHLVFEKHKIGHSWREYRWDSFCLVTPNWQCQLPGFPYAGDDPNGFMVKDEIVQYIEAYAAAFDPPVLEGIEVRHLRKEGDRFSISTTSGDYTADQVVVATGGYHRPKIPAIAQQLPASIQQLHSSQYRNPEQLPNGAVLVVGTGQSGCQIAEDLHLAGRQVHLCVGGAPRSPRRYRGKDVVEWLHEMGYYDLPVDQHPQKEAVRHKANHYVTGRDGGREIDLRQFALEGMRLHGRLKQVGARETFPQENRLLYFWDDLKQNLDYADEVAESIKKTIDGYIEKNGIDAPVDPPFRPVWEPSDEPLTLDLEAANITSVIWCTGYLSDFRWIEIPIFDGKGYPGHERGIVPGARGLYFLGLPWLYTWGSGRFSGIARDAQYLAEHILSRYKMTQASPPSYMNVAAFGS